ncbi:uncharacterized protein LOC122856247 [Aphidius gifuensis]|uniref:uncharacterized protein LOC122856247 n=1 Tax=Aphidius gifuensis TaxID=684658 RepID=UPI001CDCFAD2|nr:uncharacterized protein LOC122856247 [Aphidius gifuensis]
MSGNPSIIPSLMSISTANGVSTKELGYTDHDELPWGIEETKKKSQNGCFLCKLCNGRTIGRILNINTHVNGLKHLRNLKDFLIDKQNKLEMQIQQKAEHKKESINKHNLNSNPKLMSLNSTSSKSNCGLNNKPNIVKNTPLNTSKLSQTQDESKLSCSSSSSSSSFDIKKSDVPGQQNNYTEGTKVNIDNKNNKDVEMVTVDKKKPLINKSLGPVNFPKWESIKQEDIDKHYDDFEDFLNKLKSSSNDSINIDVKSEFEQKDKKHLPSEKHKNNIAAMDKKSADNNSINIATNQINSIVNNKEKMTEADSTETIDDNKSKEILSNEIEMLSQNRYQCKICFCHLGDPKTVSEHLKGQRLDGLKSVAQHLRGERHAAEKKIIASKNKENEQHKNTASALRHQYDFPNAITEINSSFSSLNITPLEMNNTAQNYSKTNELRFKKFEDPRKAMMNAEDCEICHIKVPGGVKGLSEHRLTNEHIDNMNKVFGFMDSSIKPAWSVPTTNTMEFNISTGLNLNNAAWPTVIDAAKSRGTVNISKLVSSDKIAEPEAKHSCHICEKKTVTRNDLHTHMSYNIIYNGPSKNLNIYEIDNDKIENIKKGITLSMTLDENNIWCFICNEKVKNSLQTFNEHICSRLHERNYEQLMEQHEQYETFNDQLSNFDLAIQYIYEISNSTVQCLPCDIMIMNKSEMIKNHIDTKNHQDKTNTYDKNKNNIYKSIHSMSNPYFYNCQVYWCVICGAKFHNEIEFREHLDKKKHRKKVEEYSHKLIFDYCPTCAVLWYGFPQTFSYHCEGKMHKYHKKDKHFFINELPSVIINDMLVNPDYYADKLVSLIDNFAENERKKEKLVLKDLTNTIKNKYPQAQHYIFGSRLIGLAFENSDIDIYLDCKHKKKSSYFGSSSIEVNEVIKEVEKCLIDKKNDWLIKRVILNARIPIIKLVHRTTLIDCDISFNNGLAVENSNLIKIYCDKNSNCRKLILFIKKWFNYCDLTRISSNAIAWLVIYYLQVQSILPAVIELIEKKTEKRTVAGWEVGVGTDIFTFTEVKDFKKLLKNFFLFYASFDYKDDIICPLLGKAVKKSLFLKPRELPASMKHYVRQLEHGHMLEVDCVMCIQDPFDLGHNITDSVDKFNVYRFMTFCISSAKILE